MSRYSKKAWVGIYGEKNTFLLSRNMSIECAKNMMDTATQQKKSGRQLLAHESKNGNEVAKEHLNKVVAKTTGHLVEFKIAEKLLY